MYDVIVVGSGFSGSVIARALADKHNKKVLVIEKRDHIAGNMYDEYDDHGVLIHKYGPHVVVTDKWEVIKYLSQYSEMYEHTVKELSFIDGKYVRLPFNFETVKQLVGEEKAELLLTKMRKVFCGEDRVSVGQLVRCEDPDISEYGKLLFNKAYVTYCAKQWDTPVEKLDASIMDRVKMVIGYDERYMNKDFQFLPQNGYTKLFENLLNHENIKIRLNEDANSHLKLNTQTNSITYDNEEVGLLVYTGAIDELFQSKYGDLPYRSLDIRYEWFDKEKVFPQEIISFPQAKGYTRKTEYRQMMNSFEKCSGSTIATEYPTAYVKGSQNSPYYPVITDDTKNIYLKYLNDASTFKNLFLCGRLAEFRYYNMDECILRAFDVIKDIEAFLAKGN